MMPKYRKLPVVVDAEQWFPEKTVDGVKYYNRSFETVTLQIPDGRQTIEIPALHALIETLEGAHIVGPGDWIITGVEGEKYPCKPEIFAQTYEPLGNDSTE